MTSHSRPPPPDISLESTNTLAYVDAPLNHPLRRAAVTCVHICDKSLGLLIEQRSRNRVSSGRCSKGDNEVARSHFGPRASLGWHASRPVRATCCVMATPAALLFDVHWRALQLCSASANAHFSGLQQASRRINGLGTRSRRKLKTLDAVAAYSRHVMPAMVDKFLET